MDCLNKLSDYRCFTLDQSDPKAARLSLLPVVSLAWYLSSARLFDVQEQAGSRLNLWVIGAELIDVADSGRLYECLGPLLGLSDVDVHLIGPDLQGEPPGGFRGLLDDYPAFLDGHFPDVAILFQPGFEENDDLLKSESLHSLVDSSCVVLGSSYSEEEYLRDRLMASAYGYALSDAADNPFSLDPADTGLYWADRMWHFKNQAPGGVFKPDMKLVSDVRCLSRMVAHSRMHGVGQQPANPGYRFMAPDGQGGERAMMHIMDGYYLDPAGGQVYGVKENRLLKTNVVLDQSTLHRIPATSDPMQLALWAAGIKEQFLMKG